MKCGSQELGDESFQEVHLLLFGRTKSEALAKSIMKDI